MTTWRLAPGVRQLPHRRIAGGAPYRIVRLSSEGATALTDLLDTPTVPHPGSGEAAMVDHLVRAGILLAPLRPAITPAEVVDTVTVVIPVLGTLGQVRAVIDRVPEQVAVVVVDDGSEPPISSELLQRRGIQLLRHDRPRGPAAARNAGAERAATPWVAFVDADVDPGEGWLEALLAHGDPDVVGLAPRIVSGPAPGVAGLIETWSGALDQGPTPLDVGPGRRVSFVPSALLLVRREAFVAVGGFVEDLDVGEDVDLVWRLLDEGRVRYEPDVVAVHHPRRTASAVLRRRFDYGTSAAALEVAHPGAIRHADVSIWSFGPWLAGLVHPVAALVAAATTVAISPRGLPQLPPKDARTLAARGHVLATVGIGRYLARPLWPLTLALLLARRRPRTALVTSLAIGYADVARRRVQADATSPASIGALGLAGGKAIAAAVLDDAAYGLGVWQGCLRHQVVGPLLPRVRDLPDWVSRRRAGR